MEASIATTSWRRRFFTCASRSVRRRPALVHLPEPYNPSQNFSFVNRGYNDATNYHDDVLYGGQFYFLWGPAPALIFLVPMHLLGLEPSSNVTVAFFAVAGLGFVLGTLRILLRQIGGVSLWMSVLAGFTLALCSAVPFILRAPSPTEDTIAGGFFCTMAGVWLATSTLARREAGLGRLALTSLCFGLAIGSRPTLLPAALVLVVVYLSLRRSHPRRGLLLALGVPISLCCALLLAYNQARFGSLLEFGGRYQLTGYDPLKVHLGAFSYMGQGVWLYLFSVLRPLALFPFLTFNPPVLAYPLGQPAGYMTPEITGGVLLVTPIVLFLAALPWIWRHRPAWLGSLAALLLVLAAAGIASMLLVSYEIFSTTERYETDFSTLLLLGGVTTWLVLSCRARGPLRRLVRVGGGLLALWGCLAGVAVSFVGYGNELAVDHPGTWSTFEQIGSPLSVFISSLAGRPVLAEAQMPHSFAAAPPTYGNLGEGNASFWFGLGERTTLTIVSPDARTAVLLATVQSGIQTPAGLYYAGGFTRGIVVLGPGEQRATYPAPPAERILHIPVRLAKGINKLSVTPLASSMGISSSASAPRRAVVFVGEVSVAPES